ncbi:lysylphosphatidylglycerol synthase transmembrane domain-containing protein [Luteibaculum oceani]|uniref:Flippase-like domain-containing protein n=1 Tax=Luteibaculum oceani TaxID=1294296 RepID=A0A5C6VJ28_9FLAO|nr:lysylphosphatidylglycerol synthase transmembrane domain-containing protein [Luteibaculum oceani]TXC85207.1 flippase-like domain-containing protein [Luteibaculum oceani]
MDKQEADIRKKLSLKRIIIPLIIGLLAAGWMLYQSFNEPTFVPDNLGSYIWVDGNDNGLVDSHDFEDFRLALPEEVATHKLATNQEILSNTTFNYQSVLWLLVALLMVVCRDFGYMYRLRILSHGDISWRNCFDSIMLWEFASAITPSVVGGSGVAIYILNREGISVGRSTSIVMTTALLDELFYIIMVPVIILLIGTSQLFPVELQKEILGITFGTEGIFWVGYGFIICLTLGILIGIFIAPRALKYWLLRIFNLRFLRKWRYKIIQIGNDIMNTSNILKDEKPVFWIKAFLATFLSWTARYWVVNFLLLAFTPVGNHLLVYGRQLVMWVIMLISPTPGGSGVAELAFSGFLAEFSPLGLAALMAFLWRIFTYYPYLFLGAIILPRWFAKTS